MGDKWEKTVADRIELNIDFVAAEAKYQRACAIDFLSNHEKLNSIGKLVDSNRELTFNDLYAYLDNNDECQYAVSEWRHIETFLDGEKGYSLEYFKEKLKERYWNYIFITSHTGKSSVVIFRDSRPAKYVQMKESLKWQLRLFVMRFVCQYIILVNIRPSKTLKMGLRWYQNH